MCCLLAVAVCVILTLSIAAHKAVPFRSVLVDSFLGTHIELPVHRNEGQEEAALLEFGDAEEGGVWSALSSMVSGKAPEPEPAKIHVFSVASGHLYERFLKVRGVCTLAGHPSHTSARV